MRTVLVPMTEPNHQENLLANCCLLTKKFKAYMTGLFVRPDPRAAIPFMGEGLTADAIQDLCDAAEKEAVGRSAATYAVFERVVTEFGLNIADPADIVEPPVATWEEAVGLIAEKVGRHARLADLAVVPQPCEGNSADSGDLLNEVLFRSGRPVLMSPPRTCATIGDHVVIGWNGRAECARTVAATLPFLQKAEKVTVLTVGDEHPDRPSLEALRIYLGRYGVTAETRHESASGRTVAKVLRDEVARAGADLLVIGAYSHSRWREMIIGGATREVINESDIPVFMSH